MGTLHKVYQLKPKVIVDGAILLVKKDKEKSFLEKFPSSKPKEEDEWSIFSNTFVKRSNDGKVQRYAIYGSDRVIDFKESGIYLSIQSGSKYGFGNDFIEGIKNISPYLENTLFYVIYDHLISRFEIENGVLTLNSAKNFDEWNYRFEEYLACNYIQSPQTLADFYVDQIIESMMHQDEMIKKGNDPGSYFEIEEYEELLGKIWTYEKYIPLEIMKKLEPWLKERIIFQKIWDDEHYD